jgi:hypothetical protein
MARTSPEIQIIEVGEGQPDSIQAVQQTARVMFARDMAELIKSLIVQGKLEVKDGQIVPIGKKCHE